MDSARQVARLSRAAGGFDRCAAFSMCFWKAPSLGMSARARIRSSAGGSLRGAERRGSPFSLLDLLVRLDIERHVGHDALELPVLFLQGFEFGELARSHARVTLTPGVERLAIDAVRSGNGFDRRTLIDFFQHPQDLR